MRVGHASGWDGGELAARVLMCFLGVQVGFNVETVTYKNVKCVPRPSIPLATRCFLGD